VIIDYEKESFTNKMKLLYNSKETPIV
jgi:hypothetical protein